MTQIICYTGLLYVFGQTNNVDSDERPQNVASHQGLHCLPLVQLFLDTALGSELYLFIF